MTPKKITVWVTTQFIGFHKWPEAPDKVSFLRNKHRHVFHVRVGVNVTHSNRDVEFFLLQEALNIAAQSYVVSVMEIKETLSCEQIAQLFADTLSKQCSVCSVTVSEDGENGATLEF